MFMQISCISITFVFNTFVIIRTQKYFMLHKNRSKSISYIDQFIKESKCANKLVDFNFLLFYINNIEIL